MEIKVDGTPIEKNKEHLLSVGAKLTFGSGDKVYQVWAHTASGMDGRQQAKAAEYATVKALR